MSGLSPDLSILLVMILVWSLYFIFKKSLFDPINKILADRDAAINGGQQQAQEKLVQCDELSQSYQKALKTARQESYRQQEKFRAEALKVRAEIIVEGRSQMESQVAAARAEIQVEVVRAKHILGAEVDGIADGIVKTILR